MSGSRRWAAFALVTVLLTVVTLLVLWYPVLADGLKDAQQASCIANLKKIILATRMYCSDWDGAYPNSALTGASYSEAYGGELPKNMQFERQRKGWPVALAPYLADSQVLWCPADGNSISPAPDAEVSYWFRHALDIGPLYHWGRPLSVADMAFADRQFLFYEHSDWHGAGVGLGTGIAGAGGHGPDLDGVASVTINCAFADGHAAALELGPGLSSAGKTIDANWFTSTTDPSDPTALWNPKISLD
jgi:prepilin-type processing-associated H-X9-DG protein